MVDIGDFKSGDSFHLIERDGRTYIFKGEAPKWLIPQTRGTATIERVDAETTTIYLSSPLRTD